MTHDKAGYIQLEGGKLYYEMAGEGQPVIFSHAGFVDSRMWDAQWDEFQQHFRVIRFDMRGYGKSDVVSSPISRRQDLYCLLQELEISRAHLVGCSLGGEVMIDFALEHPQMVSSLVAVSSAPSGFELQGDPPPHLFEMIAAVQQGDIDRASELQIRIWLDGSFREADQVDSELRQRVLAMNRIAVENGTWAKVDSQPLDPLDPPAVKRLGTLNLPLLVIAGALDHPEILRAADFMVSEVKGAKKVILNDSAHLPNMEKPAEFNRAVMDFWRALG